MLHMRVGTGRCLTSGLVDLLTGSVLHYGLWDHP